MPSQRPSAGSTYTSTKKPPQQDSSVSSPSDQSERDRSPPKTKKSSASAKMSSSSKRHSRQGDDEPKSSDDDATDEEDDDEPAQAYEVSMIKKHRVKGKTIEYKVGWIGYDSDDDTWEPEDHLEGAHELLKQYKRDHKLVSKPASRRTSTASAKSSAKKPQDQSPKPSEDEGSGDENPSSRKRKRSSHERPKSTIAPLRKNGINGPTKADRESVKNRKQAASESESASDAESVDDQEWHARYKNRSSWEGLVRSVRTIEKDHIEDGMSDAGHNDESSSISVCLLWHSGRTTWVPNKIARSKLPQKLLDFYEDHLQFSAAQP